jgi:hypothetical protein
MRIDFIGTIEAIPKEFATEVNSPCYHAIAHRQELLITWRITQISGKPGAVTITGIHVVREDKGDVEVIAYNPPVELERDQPHAVEHLIPWWDATDVYAQGTVEKKRWHVKKSHLKQQKKEWRRRQNEVREYNWRDERRCRIERMIGGPLPQYFHTADWDNLPDSANNEINALAQKYVNKD